MKNNRLRRLLAAILMPAAAIHAVASLTSMVNPMAGTGDHGHVFLGANVPLGMVQLGPSQPVKGWDWCSGYHHSDSVITGFSHTHLSGTGIGDLGDITFLPVIAATDTLSRFSHSREACRPGYYSVVLDDSGIKAELTATTRTGHHRYTYPAAAAREPKLRIDLGYGIGWDKAVATGLRVVNDSTVTGYRLSKGWAPDQRVYFAAVFSRPIAATDSAGRAYVLTFGGNDVAPLEARVGISAVSTANALANLRAEAPAFDFDATARRADADWERQLAKIAVEGGDEASRRIFYTALYHSMFFPATFCDVNGDYRRADGTTGNTGGRFTPMTVLSLWDTYRAAHPLSTVIHPERQHDYAETFIDIYRSEGKLPVWHLHGNETDCMIGNPGVIVLADLLLKGFVADTTAAFEAMKASMLLDERSLGEIKRLGYVPFDGEGCEESVAKGMEYAVADDAVARVARRLGRTADEEFFARRADAYKRYFDPSTGFMRGRSTKGEFRPGEFDPFATVHRADDYCEGNAWQYLWMVPQDPHGLMELLGGEERFVERLDSFFTAEGSLGEGASPDISGMIGQYAHGNEPSHHAIYLYNYAGRPDRAAPLLRRVMTTLYHDAPAGLCGNEDAGQMSAWFVLSAAGLYQVEPAGGRFVLGTSLFDRVTFNVGDGRRFEIVARGNSPENIHITGATLNGRPLDRGWIDFNEIRAGGTLELTMGPTPSNFATQPHARP